MKEIQLSHKDNSHITTITEFELTQILQFAENWANRTFPVPENQSVETTVKFIRLSLNLK